MLKIYFLYFFYLGLFLLIPGKVKAQDPIFSQFYANPLYLNPALTGATEYSRFTAIYRNEWPGLPAFTTYSASYDQPVDFLHGGLGMVVVNDVLGNGAFQNLSLSGIYNHEINFDRDINGWAALSVSAGQRSFKADHLVFPGQVDPGQGNQSAFSENISSMSTWFVDFSFGSFVVYRDYYGGLAIHHLAQPYYTNDENTGRLRRKFTIHTGRQIATNKAVFGRERLVVSPNLLLQLQGKSRQINYGIYFEQAPLILGGWLRQDFLIGINSVIISLGYFHDTFQVGYSYDVFIGSRYINLYKSSAHELTFSLKFQYESEKKRKGAIPCPNF